MSSYDFSKVNFADPDIARRLAQAFVLVLEPYDGIPSEPEKKPPLDVQVELNEEPLSIEGTPTKGWAHRTRGRKLEGVVQLELEI